MGLFSKTASGTTSTTTTGKATKGKREAWQIACADVGVDCAFLFRSHDKNEVAKAATSHAKMAHGMTGVTEKDSLESLRPASW